jgi:hypothetical protein
VKIHVIRRDGNGADVHEAPWVDCAVGQTGILRVHLFAEDCATVTGWEVYADGAWGSHKQAEAPTPDMVRQRSMVEQRDNGGGFGPSNTRTFGR